MSRARLVRAFSFLGMRMRPQAKALAEQLAAVERYHLAITDGDALEDWFLECPFPAWLKRYNRTHDAFLMSAINPAYERQFGIEVEAYVGLDDRYADQGPWPDQVGEQYQINDREVFEEGRSRFVVEHAVNPKTGKPEQFVICKWPVRISGERMGVGGLIVFTHH